MAQQMRAIHVAPLRGQTRFHGESAKPHEWREKGEGCGRLGGWADVAHARVGSGLSREWRNACCRS